MPSPCRNPQRLNWRAAPARVALLLLLALAALAPALAPDAAWAQTVDEEIVYIDPAGVIRVHDPQTQSGRLAITWFSPTGGYTNAALVDANNDGDMEVVGLRSASDSGFLAYRVDIYDPVVASGPVDPDDTIGSVPWALLYSLPLEDEPYLVAAGNLDPSMPGDEIFISEREPSSNGYRQDLFYLRRDGALDGRAWARIDLPISDENWSSVAIGDMDIAGTDEVALVDSNAGALEIWRVEGAAAGRIYNNESDDWIWNHAAYGNWRGDGRQLLAAVREGPASLRTLVILRISLTTGEVVDDFSESFAPGPEFAFFGDVNASGDDELFMLRSLPTTITDRARLIGRNRGTDTLATFEEPLNPDNGFRVGAAGDIDGDGRAELVIVRADALRIFTTPEISIAFSDVTLTTNARTIAIGDLDRNGYLLPVRLAASPPSLSASAAAGGSPSAQTLTLSAQPGNIAVPFAAQLVATSEPNLGRAPTWLALSPLQGATPKDLTVTFDPTRLRPGAYSAELRFTSSNGLVFDQPLVVPVTFNVTAGLLAEPGAITFRQVGCAPRGGPADLRTATFTIVAPEGTSYQASLLEAVAPADAAGAPLDESALLAQAAALGPGAAAPDLRSWPSSVPWASATSPAGVAPEALTLTVDFSKRSTDALMNQGRLVLLATVNGLQQVRSVPITLICAEMEIFSPFEAR